MSFTSEVKKYILSSCEMDLVGIADVKALAEEPAGYRPTDILPNAKTIIVFGKSMADGGVQAAFRTFEDGHPFAYSTYGAFCSDLASNFSLFFNTFNIAEYIERTFGETAMPLPCGPLQNGTPNKTAVPVLAGPEMKGLPMDISKAAVAAGLGHFGWSGHLLTPEYGPRIQFGAVVTSMELECDKPYSGEILCDPVKCGICSRVCPTKALPAYGEGEPKIRNVIGHSDQTANHNFNRCLVAACAMRREFGGMEDYIDNCDPTDEELQQAFENKPINHWDGLDHYPKWRCDKCLLYCPVGSWKERFADRGLSHGAEV